MLTKDEILPLAQVSRNGAESLVAFIKKDFPEAKAKHILKMAELAAQIPDLPPTDRQTLVYACLLHDIGYHPALVETGFHPFDGAKLLNEAGEPELAAIVACHSSAQEEAAERGLPPPALIHSTPSYLLAYLDWHVGSHGKIFLLDERLTDILNRHGADSIVGRAAIKSKDRSDVIFAALEKEFEGLPPLIAKAATEQRLQKARFISLIPALILALPAP